MRITLSPSEKAEYKKEIKEALNEYIKNHNLSEVDNQVIMNQLPNMYRYLETKGLVKYGLTWSFFQEKANETYIWAAINGVR